ncbi:monofunctional biosynthetic peptidoglycan transglycosylase [soil metagenome]
MKVIIGKVFRFFLKAGTFFVCFSFILVLTFRWLPVSYTPLMFFRLMQHTDDSKLKIEHEWISEDQISNHLKLAVVCTEDQRFLIHHGFDFEEIQKAMDESDDGGRHRGASTISQQTAKNVFLYPSSSFLRKGFEAWFTVLVEMSWSKQRILEVYLNSIEFGDGIYGCESASELFFHKHANQLTAVEAARLAVVLPNPNKFNAGNPTTYLIKRQNWALTQMRNYGGVLKFPEEEKLPKPENEKSGKKNKK